MCPPPRGATGHVACDSHDDDPLVISYESVAPNWTLGPGSYFAMFAPQGSDGELLLGSASDPFNYQAGSITLGIFDPSTGFPLPRPTWALFASWATGPLHGRPFNS
jgi:hypothetical protein